MKIEIKSVIILFAVLFSIFTYIFFLLDVFIAVLFEILWFKYDDQFALLASMILVNEYLVKSTWQQTDLNNQWLWSEDVFES